MMYERHEIIMAKFTPKNVLVYNEIARTHVGKTFRWMHFKSETIKTDKGLKSVSYFTPHDAGYEHIPAALMHDLSNVVRIKFP